MIIPALHQQIQALDRAAHRGHRVKVPVTDWSPARKLNSLFIAAVEFADACREFPVVFVRVGNDADGKPHVAPVAVFGLAQEENLFIAADGSWRGHYLPAVLRLFPFAMGRLDDNTFAVCVDTAWSGFGSNDGEALFDGDGQPSSLTQAVQKQLETLEAEVQRTKLVGDKLLELELLREMRFDATLPDGQTIAVDGFLAIDEDKLKALSDAAVVELQKSGLLGLIHAHQISLANMRRLAEWRLQRGAAANAAA